MAPRSAQWIIDHADELAAAAEAHEPDAEKLAAYGTELAGVLRAAHAQAEAQRDMVAAITAARAAGAPWRAIGSVLGCSGEAARQRFGQLVA